MDEDNISRLDAKKILSEIHCLKDSKYGLPELEQLIWEELTSRFDGIVDEITDESCPNQIPEVFQDFLDRLQW